ncbi:tRNA (5-methylaminomethyl-2-thiouridine)(34)-methyltransferase MnmD [Lampropedia aestuarii]|uniref:tRNA (5-methylaminomethyl-2-thiouridine)(34)-methyltransferase MnmD n=1 Tax=Lampropedia aestuarii TaxID=2562762 RepID=UPI002469A9EA|nr:tRNA (5-methylaminomethyl-2-thiouridine)(34)-methyltransferase MnmD [Lampropedia aestuarii]MDH5855753.1 tRNA (5-methylaminomethyl-2-thiouridine)(34)-methyltransferase MnmD [Lampropedia aestuarii]
MNHASEPESSPQAIDWLEDGSPFSTRFNDRYHSRRDGGLLQSVGSFLHGCHLPSAWAKHNSWCVLETGFGLGLNFLVTWQAWRDDPERPQQLHFVSTEAWPVSAAEILAAAQQRYPQLLELAQALVQQYWDMHSGIHRISLDNNRVHLTLAIGDAQQWLRSQSWQADSVYLDGFSPAKNPDIWSLDTLKAVARCCKAGQTRLATWCAARHVRDALSQVGFQVERVAGIAPKKHNVQALYAPAWPLKKRSLDTALTPPLPVALRTANTRRCVVIGAGIAGASTARAMAERGWHVTVVERADGIAQGASALPAGLFAPHITPDDAPLSRLTRAGLRATRKTAKRLLREALDWQASGVIEHRVDKHKGLPLNPATDGIASQASINASAEQRLQAGIDAQGDSPSPGPHPAIWHAYAGWIKPAQLVAALLDHPLIEVHTHTTVLAITPATPLITPPIAQSQTPSEASPTAPWSTWSVRLAATQAQAAKPAAEAIQADCVIIAAAHQSKDLLAPLSSTTWPLNAVRGQVAWGDATDTKATWPAWPINGKGSLIRVPQDTPNQTAGAHFWISAGTFEREHALAAPNSADIATALATNRQRLGILMPAIGAHLAEQLFDAAAPSLRTWSGVRCTVADRTPLYGAISTQQPNLLLATGLGSRGLTLSLLCAEALVCALHEEPLPIEQSLAKLLSTSRI